MKILKVIKLITEGDCEGRSTQTKGYFIGSLSQIITYCVNNNINPYYYFKAETVQVIDVSDLPEELQVSTGGYGRLEYKTNKQLEEEKLRNIALKKLTDEEKRLLGIKE